MADPKYRAQLNEKRRQYRKAHGRSDSREYKRKYELAQHGWTVAEYEIVLNTQGGRCAICGQPPRGRGVASKLHADHNHASGKARGLLCSACNTGLGLFRDDLERLEAALQYLKKHQ